MTTSVTGWACEAAWLASHAPTAWICLYCRDEAVIVMTVGWIGRLLAADAALVPGVRVAALVAVGLAAGHTDTRIAAVPTASTMAAAVAIASRLCLRVSPRWEAALPPG